MKKIIALVIILIALMLGGYYAMGFITEKTVKNDLESINKSNGLSVKTVVYERGLYTSKALLDWHLHVPERIVTSETGQSELIPAQDFEMRMPLVIHHGPIIVANNTVKFGMGYANATIPLPEKYLEQFNKLFTSASSQPKLNFSIFVNYLNNSKVELEIPTFKLFAKDGGLFEWEGMTSSVNVNDNGRKFKGDISLTGFQAEKEDVHAKSGKIDIDYNIFKSENGLYLGDARVSYPSLLVTKKAEKLLDLSDFKASSSSNIEEGLFSSSLSLSIDKVYSHGKNYGPGKLNMAIKNLDAEVLAEIQKKQQANGQQGAQFENSHSLLTILPDVPKLLSRGPEFEITEFSFVMPEGTLEGTLSINLPKNEAANPFELMQKMKGKGQLKVPAEVVRMLLDESNRQKLIAQRNLPVATPGVDAMLTDNNAVKAEAVEKAHEDAKANNEANPATHALNPSAVDANTTLPAPASTGAALEDETTNMTKAQLSSMLQSGLLIEDGSYYTIDAIFEDGKLTVNGKPFNAAMVKF